MVKGKTKRGSLMSFSTAVRYIESNKISNIIMAIALVLFGWKTMQNNERVIMIPPNISEEVIIAENNANGALKKYWADWFVGLVGNISPASRDAIVEDIRRVLATNLMNTFEQEIDMHIETLRLQEVKEVFIVKDSDYIAEVDIVWVYGDKEELSRREGRSDPMPFTYEIKVNVRDGRPVIESYTMYEGAPRISQRLSEINQINARSSTSADTASDSQESIENE